MLNNIIASVLLLISIQLHAQINDAKINFRPPSFEDAKIIIKEGETLTIPIILR